MNKHTKIVATLGPSSDSEEMIEKLINHGVNIFRFNFKHNTVEYHGERIELVNKVAKRIGKPIGTLIDLQGPSLRINMPGDQLELKKGDLLVFGEQAFSEGKKGFSITHPDIISHLEIGQKLLADDGNFTFYVESRSGDETIIRSDTDGVLKNRKSINIPGSDFPFPILIERDFEGLKLAALKEIDFIALSFVRSGHDLEVVKEQAAKHGVKGKIIAKIETQTGLDNIDEIIEKADGIMVARGDLGVEIPIEQVPYYQKMMIRKCMEAGKPVITATQMLQSMVDFPHPTRAEVSDVANAVYDETDCVMLSAESASGKYPLKAVEMMSKILAFNEPMKEEDLERTFDFSIQDTTSMICDSAYALYLQYLQSEQKLGGFLIYTQTGRTAQLLARYRPRVPVFAFTRNNKIRDMLTIHFGVLPFVEEAHDEKEVTRIEVEKTIEFLKKQGHLKDGEKVIVLHGDHWGVVGGTSTVRVVEA